MIGTATLRGLYPEAYLSYAITHINEHRISKIAELVPWSVAARVRRISEVESEIRAVAAELFFYVEINTVQTVHLPKFWEFGVFAN